MHPSTTTASIYLRFLAKFFYFILEFRPFWHKYGWIFSHLCVKVHNNELSTEDVIAAGSLVDFALEQVGMPVGRITSLHVRPLSFIEFLCALGKQHLASAIMSFPNEEGFASPIHAQLLDLVGHYLAIGGMPEAVKCWRDAADPNQCFEVHQELITTYRQDFNKYAKKTQLKYLDILFKDIPRQVGHRFKYSAIDGDYRKRELAPCLDLLCTAGVAHKVIRSAANGLPLGGESYPNDFKAIFLDVAIGQAVIGIGSTTFSNLLEFFDTLMYKYAHLLS